MSESPVVSISSPPFRDTCCKAIPSLLPLLAFLVRVVFAIPVASSKSERVFSVAGNTVTQKRASLAPEKVEACVIVKSNVSLLREMGFRK